MRQSSGNVTESFVWGSCHLNTSAEACAGIKPETRNAQAVSAREKPFIFITIPF
jgi:hypothetical protein